VKSISKTKVEGIKRRKENQKNSLSKQLAKYRKYKKRSNKAKIKHKEKTKPQ